MYRNAIRSKIHFYDFATNLLKCKNKFFKLNMLCDAIGKKQKRFHTRETISGISISSLGKIPSLFMIG